MLLLLLLCVAKDERKRDVELADNGSRAHHVHSIISLTMARYCLFDYEAEICNSPRKQTFTVVSIHSIQPWCCANAFLFHITARTGRTFVDAVVCCFIYLRSILHINASMLRLSIVIFLIVACYCYSFVVDCSVWFLFFFWCCADEQRTRVGSLLENFLHSHEQNTHKHFCKHKQTIEKDREKKEANIAYIKRWTHFYLEPMLFY